MRILILCGATFVVGLLAGPLLMPDSSKRSRSSARETAQRGRTVEPRDSYRDDYDAPRATDEPGAAATPRRNADVRTLAREATREMERYTTGDAAATLLSGDGTIRGTVRDPSGIAVAGVVVTAVPDTQPPHISIARREARQQPHKDRDLSNVASEAIASEMWRRDARRTAKSDANGKFAITGLTDSNHTLTAYHDDYEVAPLSQRGRVQPDAVVDFLAKPISEVKVEVRLPDGNTAEFARVLWDGPQGRGSDMWTVESGTVRMPLGALKVEARTWLPEPMESEKVDYVVGPRSSEDALVLQMKERRVLSASLELPEGFAVPGNVMYRVRPYDDAAPIEPEDLLRGPNEFKPYAPTPARAMFFDLEPGRYLVAAFLNRRRLLGAATVDVGEGSQEVSLPMEPPESGTYLTVRLVGPDGGPIPGNVSFRIVAELDGRSRTTTVDALPGPDQWLVMFDTLAEKGATQGTLRVGTRDFGGATAPVSLRGGQTVTLKFGKPARLSVELDNYKGSGVEGALYVALRGELGADGWGKVAPDGTCDLRGVQPGPYKLTLFVRRGKRNWPIHQRDMNLREGDDKARVAMPMLHTLTVRWAAKGRPRNAQIRSQSDTVGPGRMDARMSGRVATFRDLAPGEYRVDCGGKRAKVRVPGTPEVVLE
jgi:hypothetical protein